MTDERAVDGLVAETVAAHGRLDIMICNAGGSASTTYPPHASVAEFVATLKAGTSDKEGPAAECSASTPGAASTAPRFGDFGGRFIPETLMAAHKELEVAYAQAMSEPGFHEEVAWLRKEFIGGPTPMYHAKRLTEKAGGAQIWLSGRRGSEGELGVFLNDQPAGMQPLQTYCRSLSNLKPLLCLIGRRSPRECG